MERISLRRVGLALLFAGAALVVFELRPSGAPHAPSATGPATTTMVVVDRSRASVVDAALGFLKLTEDAPRLGPSGAASAQRSVSTARSADASAADVQKTLGELLAAYPSLRIRVAALAWRATPDGDGWRVAIWYVETLEVGESVLDDWRTVTYRLVWERDRWLIDERTSVRGPVPARAASVAPTSASEFASALAGFENGR